MAYIPCKACNETGIGSDGEECRACDGTGVIWVKGEVNTCWLCGEERDDQARGAICGLCWPLYIQTSIRRHWTQEESSDMEMKLGENKQCTTIH